MSPSLRPASLFLCLLMAAACGACAEDGPSVMTPEVAPSPGAPAAEAFALDLQWSSAAVAWAEAAEAARHAGASDEVVETFERSARAARTPRIDHPSGLTMVLIPPGDARVGSPLDEAHRDLDEPLRTVRIDRPYYLSTTEVTQAQYEGLMGRNPSRFVGPDRPVDSVSREDAEAFLAALAAKHGGTWRLPTEVEWEWACRAGTTTAYHYGEVLTAARANIRENDTGTPGSGLKDVYRKQTVAVGGFEPNAFGLFDMHGNVWEWTSDIYREDPSAEAVAADSARGVLRGGAWNFRGGAARAAARLSMPASKAWDCNGFRVLLEP